MVSSKQGRIVKSPIISDKCEEYTRGPSPTNPYLCWSLHSLPSFSVLSLFFTELETLGCRATTEKCKCRHAILVLCNLNAWDWAPQNPASSEEDSFSLMACPLLSLNLNQTVLILQTAPFLLSPFPLRGPFPPCITLSWIEQVFAIYVCSCNSELLSCCIIFMGFPHCVVLYDLTLLGVFENWARISSH